MNTALVTCPLCGGALRPWFRKQDRTMVRCASCRFISVTEGLKVNADGISIYEADENIFLDDVNTDYYLDESNMMSARAKLDWVHGFVPESARLLDVGANFGHFLKAAEGSYKAVGLELSPQAVAFSRANFNVDNRTASLYEPPEDLHGPFDIVTCWDVIEHVPDAVAAIRNLSQLVRPGGYLFISTPDAQSLVARITGRYWHYLDPVQHISLFGRNNLAKLLETHGLAVEGIRSFGHYYRVRYIAERLLQLHGESWLRPAALGARALLKPFNKRIMFLKLGDVLGIAARKKESGHGG